MTPRERQEAPGEEPHNFDCVSRLCSLIHWNMHVYMRDRLKDMGIGRGQLPFLMVLHQRPGINQEMLAGLLELDKGTVARGLKKLECAGMVVREKVGRSHVISLTGAAEGRMRSLEVVWKEANSLLLEGLSVQESEQLATMLAKAHENSRRGEADV
ncbi:MAG: MarR family winged helix-turn-helix transcriptional regulator [Candidatus Methanomethylophilaceae archaeon]|nr:MarR family winged helix-turn-helix transcriptional regulator [Candidatus Methanomethylophilaceae archaeon]